MNAKGSRTKVATDKSSTISDMPLVCADETAAVEFFERVRWGADYACVHCGSVNVYKMTDRKTGARNKRFLWRCKDCDGQYTVRVGTILSDSPIPLRVWAFAFWSASSCKNGVSALEIRRKTGLSYKSALFLMHRIRHVFSDNPNGPGSLLTGTIEVDETYVGGKPRAVVGANPRAKGRNTKSGRGTDKTPVVALVQRGGDVRSWSIQRVNADTLHGAILGNVARSASIVTDEWAAYRGIGKFFKGGHRTVNHGKGEYVRGKVYTNTAEGYFSLLKRGINGTFHSVSRKYLDRYCAEFAYRYNTRKLSDGERLLLAIKRGDGKRLTYKDHTAA